MNINIRLDVFHHEANEDNTNIVIELLTQLIKLNKSQNKKIMATQAELAQALQDITDQNEKARVEILGKISDLETALENAGSTSPEVDEKLAALKASVQTDDDIVPDAEPEPTPEP